MSDPADSRNSRSTRGSGASRGSAASPTSSGTCREPLELTETLLPWFRDHARDLPWRRTHAWGVLVSEVMLQQTQVSRVLPVWQQWLDRWPTPAALADSSPADAVRAWGRLGYPRRALRLHAAAVAISERHDGRVPDHLDDLLALPGVGAYTARAVAAFAFGRRHPVVDTNVRRVVARAVDGQGDAGPASQRRDYEAMERLLPASTERAAEFSAAVMELGALVCTARSPRCDACPIRDACRWRAAGSPAYEGRRAPREARFEGSDRQLRGHIMASLRASVVPITARELASLTTDAARLDRALASLLADGLAVAVAGGDAYALPG